MQLAYANNKRLHDTRAVQQRVFGSFNEPLWILKSNVSFLQQVKNSNT